MLRLHLVFLALLALSIQGMASVHTSRTDGASNLWVDAETGSDTHDGKSAGSALRTIQAASNLALPGTVIHILPGIYRESIIPFASGEPAEPIIYFAEDGPGTVAIRGSTPASSLTWNRLSANEIGLPEGVDPANIYYADLSAWNLDAPPRFLVDVNDESGVITRLMPAREPDWQVKTPWKDTEYWWLADGGSGVAGCDPVTDLDHHCDLPWRSFTQLIDISTDTDPADIEPGSLATLGDLTGATLVAMDAQHALYIYRRTIIAHAPAEGLITVDESCDNDGSPGLGWGSKYYVENHPALLDQPGEWFFDPEMGYLYVWPPDGDSPERSNMEISHLDIGFDLTNRSHIELDGLTIELFNRRAFVIWNQNPKHKATGNVIRNSTLRYANAGIVLYQYLDKDALPENAIDGFTLENSEIAFMDTAGIDSSFWWAGAPAPDNFDHAGVTNILIVNNQLHDLGFNSEARSAVGVRIFFPDKLRFENNTIRNIAQSGAHLHLSLIDSLEVYDVDPQEIKIGDILIANNLFEKTCLRASDCGALKIGGSNRPDTHIFRNVLVIGNTFRDVFGWSYVSLLRKTAQSGDGNGLYIDYASGIHVYRNIAYNNTGAGFKLSCLWRDGDAVFLNNIAANNGMFGFKLTGGMNCDTHNGSVNTQLVNNILVNNGAYGIQIESAYATNNFGNLTIDHNLYYLNGWNTDAGWGNPADILLFQGAQSGQYFHNLAEIRAGTPWEDNGVEGDPQFLVYDASDHDPFDNSTPDFHLIPESVNAIDRGSAELPDSLSRLMAEFGVGEARLGDAFDIGRYETGSIVVETPLPPVGNLPCLPFAIVLIFMPVLFVRYQKFALPFLVGNNPKNRCVEALCASTHLFFETISGNFGRTQKYFNKRGRKTTNKDA